MFHRWANGADGVPAEVAEGGCSGGFVSLEPVLLPPITTVTVGKSLWRVAPTSAAVDMAAEAIRLNRQLPIVESLRAWSVGMPFWAVRSHEAT